MLNKCAPYVLLKNCYCKCKKGCDNLRCACRKEIKKCSELCLCINCTNGYLQDDEAEDYDSESENSDSEMEDRDDLLH